RDELLVVERRRQRARRRRLAALRVRVADARPNLGLILRVLPRGADVALRERALGRELSLGRLAVAVRAPSTVLDAERTDRDRLLFADDEVLSDLAILLSALHDGAREHVDRRVAFVLEDELVHRTARRVVLAHLRPSLPQPR